MWERGFEHGVIEDVDTVKVVCVYGERCSR
jgi:hypothetical protein